MFHNFPVVFPMVSVVMLVFHKVVLHTLLSLFINPMKTIDISPTFTNKSHSYWSYVHQLSIHELGHHLADIYKSWSNKSIDIDQWDFQDPKMKVPTSGNQPVERVSTIWLFHIAMENDP